MEAERTWEECVQPQFVWESRGRPVPPSSPRERNMLLALSLTRRRPCHCHHHHHFRPSPPPSSTTHVKIRTFLTSPRHQPLYQLLELRPPNCAEIFSLDLSNSPGYLCERFFTPNRARPFPPSKITSSTSFLPRQQCQNRRTKSLKCAIVREKTA